MNVSTGGPVQLAQFSTTATIPFQYVYTNDDGVFAVNGQFGRATYRYGQTGPQRDYQLFYCRSQNFEPSGGPGDPPEGPTQVAIYHAVGTNLFVGFGQNGFHSPNDPQGVDYYPLYFSTDGATFYRWFTPSGTYRRPTNQTDIQNINAVATTNIGNNTLSNVGNPVNNINITINGVPAGPTGGPTGSTTPSGPTNPTSPTGSTSASPLGHFFFHVLLAEDAASSLNITVADLVSSGQAGLSLTGGVLGQVIQQGKAAANSAISIVKKGASAIGDALGSLANPPVGFYVAMDHQAVQTVQTLTDPALLATVLPAEAAVAIPFIVLYAQMLAAQDQSSGNGGARLNYVVPLDLAYVSAF
jgi:hypothetical protein